jgi:hypothetical protein
VVLSQELSRASPDFPPSFWKEVVDLHPIGCKNIRKWENTYPGIGKNIYTIKSFYHTGMLAYASVHSEMKVNYEIVRI